MNKERINKIVAYIKSQDSFPFDVMDIKDEFAVVLEYYGIYIRSGMDEYDLFENELLKLAEVSQTSEMVRLASLEYEIIGDSKSVDSVKIGQSVSFQVWLKSLPEDLQKSFYLSLAGKALSAQ
jgi:hypothetical protein